MSDTQSDATPTRLDGTLTIRTITGAHAILRQALASQPVVRLDCTRADSVDLSFIQLLLAARRSAQQAGKSFNLTAPAAGALHTALEQGGFLPACGADPFWSGDA